MENKESKETKTPQPISVVKSYFIKGVKFDLGLEEYVSIRKHQRDFSMEDHIFQTKALECEEFATKEEDIRAAWETVKPITALQAFKNYVSNSQRLMTVLSIMGPEATFKALKSKVKNEETVTKTQKRTFLKDNDSINFDQTKKEDSPSVASDLFEIKEVTYNDKYILHEVEADQFGENSGLENPIYVLQVECPSTHQHYFIFVDSTEPQCQDAIGAVAWTMTKDNGDCLTREEYLTLQSEA